MSDGEIIKLRAKVNVDIRDLSGIDTYKIVENKIYEFLKRYNIASDETVYIPTGDDFICLGDSEDLNDPYNVWIYFETIEESRKRKIKKILKDG